MGFHCRSFSDVRFRYFERPVSGNVIVGCGHNFASQLQIEVTGVFIESIVQSLGDAIPQSITTPKI